MDDREIVALFLKRDESALREASAKYGGRLIRLAFALLRDEGAAEECLQDALLDAWESIPPNEPSSYLFAYLGRLIRCRAIDRLERDTAEKRSARMVELTRELTEALPSGESVEETASANELSRLINEYLASLPKEKRDIFVRRYWFMDSVKEIARLTGSGESRIKMILSRLREGLRKHLEKNGFNIRKGD